MPLRHEQITPGMRYLACQLEDGEWALWHRADDGLSETMHVNWHGIVEKPPLIDGTAWPPNGTYRVFPVRPENFEAIIMAAHHMNKEQWARFAWRQSERQFLEDVG